jgi:hypothetical protein
MSIPVPDEYAGMTSTPFSSTIWTTVRFPFLILVVIISPVLSSIDNTEVSVSPVFLFDLLFITKYLVQSTRLIRNVR